MRTFLISALVLFYTSISAQDREVHGTVTSARDHDPLAGATVRLKGTGRVAVSNSEGKYSIKIPSGDAVIEVSYVGYAPFTGAVTGTVLNVGLEELSNELQEVTINSALGVSRSERSLGYAAQQLKAEDLTSTKQQDLGTALAGKIAGVQVLGGSGAKFGTSSIRLRGVNGIDGGNDPLYVVDGVVVPSTEVNMDNVEDLTVLKGPSATSLYGQRGSEGVVVITSKHAKGKGMGIELNQSTTFEKVAVLPEQQNEYGGGGTQEWSIFHYDPALDDPALQALDGAKYYDYAYDESWGPRMDGTLYAPWYAWNKYDQDYATLQPFSPQPGNVKSFYETGAAYNTNVAFSKGGDNFNMRVSYTNISRTGVSPNTKQGRNLVSFSGVYSPTAKLTFTGNGNFNTTNTFNPPNEGYNQNTASSFNQFFHRDIEMDKLRNYQNPDGTFTTWNITSPRNLSPKYTNNPYTEVYMNTENRNNTQTFGSLGVSYRVMPALVFNFTARGSYRYVLTDSRIASGTVAQERYSTGQSRSRENNYVGNADYNKEFGPLSLHAALYGELRINRSEDNNMATSGGFTVPNFYNIAASKDRPTVSNSTTDKKVQSVYGFASFGYRNYLFLDMNLRNDWSSSLPEDHNSYLYGGVSGSFVFSELVKSSILSFGKLYASVGRVGSDIDPYKIHQVYNSTGIYGNIPSMTVPDQIPNEQLKPALSTSYEGGLDIRLLNNRISASFNYYDRRTTNQIISLTIPAVTGFSSALINAGEIGNHGYEVSVGGIPVKTSSFSWDMTINLAVNKNKIYSLYPGIDNFQLGNFGWGTKPTVNREVGQPYGTLIVNGPKRNEAGDILVDDDGYPIIENNHSMGTYLPDFTGGIHSAFTYKKFSLSFSIDFQKGGKFLSITDENLHMAGLSPETVGLNEQGIPKRDPVDQGGGILIHGVRESDGQPNSTYVDTQNFWESKVNYVWEYYVNSSAYVKMRELSLGYELPARWTDKIGAGRSTISLIAQNPWLIYTGLKGIDPSEAGGNWMEGGQLPGTRSIGLNLKLTF